MEEAEQHKLRSQKHKEAFEKKLASAQKEKGLLIVNTGTGKGKTTAAMGMGVRVLGHGMKLGIVQFIKGALDSAERNFLSSHPLCTFKTIGEGYTWNVQDLERDKTTARKGWDEAVAMIRSGEYKMIILDELNVVLKYNYLPLDEVVSVLTQRDENLHVVVTGRHAPPELVDAADLVSEMKPIKHPYKEQGIKAQKGVEF
jgi:cob(I)alamin adenosyltransferase